MPTVIEKIVSEDNVSKEIDKMLSTPYWLTFNSVTEISEREDSNQIT